MAQIIFNNNINFLPETDSPSCLNKLVNSFINDFFEGVRSSLVSSTENNAEVIVTITGHVIITPDLKIRVDNFNIATIVPSYMKESIMKALRENNLL